MVLLVGDDTIDVVLATEAVVHATQETVAIWRKVNPNDFGALVADDVQEARILMGEAVVVLTPHLLQPKSISSGKQILSLHRNTYR